MYSNYNLLSALNVLSRLSLNQYKVVHHVCATPLYKHFCKQKQAVFNPQMEHYILKGEGHKKHCGNNINIYCSSEQNKESNK